MSEVHKHEESGNSGRSGSWMVVQVGLRREIGSGFGEGLIAT